MTAGGIPAPAFSATGTLPGGVTLSTSGLLSGTPDLSTGGQTFNFNVTASNGVPPDANQAFALRINRRPVANNPGTLATNANTSGSVSASKLRALASDPDSDALTVTGVSASSAQGGNVVLVGNSVTYMPPANYVGPDSFTFTVTDGFPGSTATGTVNVSVRSTQAASLNIVSISTNGAGTTVVAQGIPGFNYVVQFSDTMQASWSNLSGTLTADSNGRLQYLDTTQPPPTQRFYRVVSVP